MFNHSQEEAGRPKVSIHPHKCDYCDTCKYHKEKISRQQAILKRLSQSGLASEQEMREVQVKIDTHNDQLRLHKEEANAAREYHNTMIQRCKDDWLEIIQLSQEQNSSPETVLKLAVAQHKFTLVLSADYQQSKLIPHWGNSEQAGSIYYLQKVGPKNTDHTISFLSSYIQKSKAELPWLNHICVFLDNAGSTNKNRFLFSWGMEVVKSHQLDNIRFCFLVAGHTKFEPDVICPSSQCLQ